MQVQHIGSSVSFLRIAEIVRRPIGALLLFRQLNTKQFRRQVFEAMAIENSTGALRSGTVPFRGTR